jgi:lipoprotein-anchoring transpeptidase ErfK/SrfK
VPEHDDAAKTSSFGSAVSGWVSRLAVLVVVAFVVAIGVVFLTSPEGGSKAAQQPRQVDLTKLVASTTKTTLPRAPQDTEPQATTEGDVVHPKRVIPVYAAPGKRPFAKVAPRQMGETWLPVVDRRNGWAKVLLPSKPNGAAGWLRMADVQQRRTPYLIRVHVGSRQLELYQDGELVGSWTVAVGAPETPTPTGRTFLLGSIVDPNQSYSPVILPLGSHSNTLDTYGGGPGTVALHGWPDSSVFGNAVSHGCIRVPSDALDQLSQVPLGSLVIIDDN